MAASIKVELEQTKLRLEFYISRAEQQPNHIHKKWIEIYSDRVKKLEKQLQKTEQKTKSSTKH